MKNKFCTVFFAGIIFVSVVSCDLGFVGKNFISQIGNNAYLKSIETSPTNGTNASWSLAPGFSSYNSYYTLPAIPNSQNTLAISVEPEDKNISKIEMKGPSDYGYKIVNKGVKNSYYTKEFTGLSVGKNVFKIKVTAEDKSTYKEYTVSVTRTASAGAGSETEADYAILVYGCGGGNLDDALDFNLSEAARIGTNANVKMAAQIKYSNKYQGRDNMTGTLRKVLNGKTWETKGTLDKTIDLGKSETLSAFLKWAKQAVPAKEYILIIWNHGNVWDPYNDSPTPRAAVFDDTMDKKALSTASLAKGITDSGVNVSTVYYDVCLMLMMETVAEIHANAKTVKYVMGAEHLTPGIGGNYALLMKEFGLGGILESQYEEHLRDYVCGTAPASWWDRVSTPHDLSVVKMKNFNDVLNAMKNLVDAIAKLTEKKSVLEAAYADRYNDLDENRLNEESTDLLHFMKLISDRANNTSISNSYSALENAIDNEFLIRTKNKNCKLDKPSIGILVTTSSTFNGNFIYPHNTIIDYDEVYKKTAFDKAVKWSKILQFMPKY